MLLQHVYNSTDNTYKLLENLLTWARSQQGEIPYEPGAYKIAGIVKQVEDLLNDSAQKKGIALTSEIDADYKVYCDEKMVQTILRNLVSNSIKFTRQDGKITIRTSLDDEGQVLVSVSDTGIGMSEPLMNSLFKIDEKGSSMQGTAGETGTGLGLIISNDFLGKHGSKLQVTSTVKSGSTFSFSLKRVIE
jgi:signal transduction histidine kinase